MSAKESTSASETGFDHRRLDLHRRRAEAMARHDAGFLVVRVAGEMADRLAATNRDFTDAVDVLTPTSALAEAVREARPGLHLTRLPVGRSDHDDLGLDQGSLDLAVSAFGLHWSNDIPGALAQIRRALRPDGLFMATLPGQGTLGELRSCLIEVESELTSGAATRVDPFVDIRQAGALLQRAGFALPVVDSEELTVRYGSVAALVGDLRAMGATSARAGRIVPLPRAALSRLERAYAARFSDPDGRLRATFNLVHLTGWAPHESQQKPLRPGSAQLSLADFLKKRD